MKLVLLFEFKDIYNWIGGLVALLLFCALWYFIGQVGVQIKSGINILKFISKAEKEAKAKGLVITQKGIALKKKGNNKIIYSFLGIALFYACVILFVPHQYQIWSLPILVPIVFGYFGIFLVPEQLAED